MATDPIEEALYELATAVTNAGDARENGVVAWKVQELAKTLRAELTPATTRKV
jgi:hypothetical protein